MLNLAALMLLARRRADQTRQLSQERGRLMGTSVNGILSIESLKAMGSESDFFKRWSGQHAKTANAEQAAASGSQLLTVLPGVLVALNTVALLAIGSERIMHGLLTAGLVMAFQLLMRNFLEPVNRLVGLGGRVQDLAGDIVRLEDVLEQRIDTQFQQAPLYEIKRLAGEARVGRCPRKSSARPRRPCAGIRTTRAAAGLTHVHMQSPNSSKRSAALNRDFGPVALPVGTGLAFHRIQRNSDVRRLVGETGLRTVHSPNTMSSAGERNPGCEANEMLGSGENRNQWTSSERR